MRDYRDVVGMVSKLSHLPDSERSKFIKKLNQLEGDKREEGREKEIQAHKKTCNMQV